ncbi:MAG: hypothetical protein KGI90_07775 [Burkholderiales bacterium]|nr:hypothetical protein [Burkholderiales bacterium]
MSRWPTEAMVGRRLLGAWRRVRDRSVPEAVFLQPDAAWRYGGPEAIPERIMPVSDWAATLAGSSVRLVLSGALTQQILVEDPATPLADEEAVRGWGRHQFIHYHGRPAEQWALAAWHDASQRGVAAVSGIDLGALRREAEQHRIVLRAIQPWWAVALHAAGAEVPALMLAPAAELWLVEGAQVTRLRSGLGRLTGIEQHWLDRADVRALADLLGSLQVDGAQAWVHGYGLDENGVEALPARRLGSLSGSRPAPRWLGT